MTENKPIMIDGVDVSNCENYNPKGRFTCNPHICNCHQKPNCYFKQLSRKTQECEELKRQYKELGQCSKRMKEYFEKEKETLSNRFLKLKQILAEIKEIAKNFIKNVSDRCVETTPMYGVHKQILQKISECEVEE